jgi:hypothetical protein
VREVAGSAAVDLLQVPAPVARLTGGEAAEDLGAFSYRYFADGTIEPDARWVRDNIRTEQVPVLGRVTCHRLMLPQLRGALQEVQDAGLAGTLKTYDGCYVPRFIERNPRRSISLHTWGIAIDMDAATNYRGIRGTMDRPGRGDLQAVGLRLGRRLAVHRPDALRAATILTLAQGLSRAVRRHRRGRRCGRTAVHPAARVRRPRRTSTARAPAARTATTRDGPEDQQLVGAASPRPTSPPTRFGVALLEARPAGTVVSTTRLAQARRVRLEPVEHPLGEGRRPVASSPHRPRRAVALTHRLAAPAGRGSGRPRSCCRR